MNVSIIIPSYNTQDCIGRTLQCISQQQLENIHIEIIVVDCSEDDRVKRVTQQYPNVRFQHESTRFNPGIGRNIGAQLATGDLLMFIDADVELAPNAIVNAAKHHTKGAKIFGGALELNPETSIGSASYLEHYFFNHESQARRPAQARNNLSSALMCFDKSLFLSEGGFKDIPRMQDTELTERLKAKGLTLYFYPDILGLQTQDSPLDKVKRKIFINGQNLYYIRYKHRFNALKKALFFIILPLFAATKTARIIARHLIYQNSKNKLRTLAISPLLIMGGAYWMAGFYQAMLSEEGISSKRD